MTFTPIAALPLFLAMLLLLALGRRLRSRFGLQTNGAIEGAIFALLGLILAFTFSGAIGRYDVHRQLITEEANDIGTAYLRLDLLPAPTQPQLRQLFRSYVDSRLNQYQSPAISPVSPETVRLQREIWTATLAATAQPGTNPDAIKLLIPALNTMIDVTSTRQNAFNMHPPSIVYTLLLSISCVCALLAGLSISPEHRPWLDIVLFAFVISLTIYSILDIEYPRRGLVRLTDYDQILVSLRSSMN